MANASFDVHFEFVNGVQTLSQYNIKDPQVYQMPAYYNGLTEQTFVPEKKSYLAVFDALSLILSGNITTTLYDSQRAIPGPVILGEESSDVLHTALGACDDFTASYWNGNEVGMGVDGDGFLKLAPWHEAFTPNRTKGFDENLTYTYIFNSTALPPTITPLFTQSLKPEWMCRNRTLRYAVEDLMNNITISLLSQPEFTSTNPSPIQVTTFKSTNIYHYNSRNLILSYSIAICLTLLMLLLGLYSLLSNGVAHSASFSALITTTRNSRLDELSRGHSLGALPLDEKVLGAELRFGECGEWDGETHLGFGFAGNV
ncbi:hypothetical protein LSUE1_G010187, partial [Lachnellula suecica]